MDMLETFLKQQPAISALLLSPKVHRSEKDACTLREADITVAEDIAKALRPMKTATLVMSEKSSSTLLVIVPLHSQLLEDMSHSSGDSTVVKDLRSAVQDDLRFRYSTFTKTTIIL